MDVNVAKSLTPSFSRLRPYINVCILLDFRILAVFKDARDLLFRDEWELPLWSDTPVIAVEAADAIAVPRADWTT